MTSIPLDAQVFDLVFHPSHCTAYVCTLSGEVKATAFDHTGRYQPVFTTSVSQRSCRGISITADGSSLYVAGKGKALQTINTIDGRLVQSRSKAHDAPINCVKYLTSWLVSTGDDDGVIKLWDPRQRESTRTYTHHFDYITDFLWLEDKKQLVATSGDGSLSVLDVRAKKTEPLAHSEDQEDELMAIAPIKSGTKFAVGMQTGVLSIFNRSSGWGDCVDRIPGHPQSVDTLCGLPESFQDVDSGSTLLTGSSDGIVRAMQVFPTRLLGVVADHGEWPVERVGISEAMEHLTIDGPEKPIKEGAQRDDDGEEDEDNAPVDQGRWWVGSVGHDETLRLTSLRTALQPEHLKRAEDDAAEAVVGGESGDESEGDEDEDVEADDGAEESSDEDASESEKVKMPITTQAATETLDGDQDEPSGADAGEDAQEESDSDDSDAEPQSGRKRKTKPPPNPLAAKRTKGRNEMEETGGKFFDDL
ncbi:WD40 repeat-like protein [Cylindrobasidium torrendii FP15055 ss-10]|uniref:WD repeat-containing protein JIP5 n=1 Tax=Cylindrobasidium torrendii FP15055 ss-10 TaxID=1314674 RepID=A0A0D7BJ39_9AGAR|nr:WD40 repeat-like protein [Cylindrobasidium torrendii FP15055 ss-10]